MGRGRVVWGGRVVKDDGGAGTVIEKLGFEEGEGFLPDVWELVDLFSSWYFEECPSSRFGYVFVDTMCTVWLRSLALYSKSIHVSGHCELTTISGRSHQKAVREGRSMTDLGRSSSIAALNLSHDPSK